MPAPKKPSKKPAKPQPAQQLASIDPGQLDNVTGGCGGGQRRHCCGGQQQQMNYYPYQQQGQYGGYGGYGSPYDVQTTVDYGNGQQQIVSGGTSGVPTSGNTYIR